MKDFKSLIIMIIISISLVWLIGGCATYSSQSKSNTGKENIIPGRLVEHKDQGSVFDRIRAANDRQLQDFRKSKSVTYSKIRGGTGLLKSRSDDQRDIMILEGPPDYVRSFKTHRGKKVDEWLYEKKDYQIQFQEGKLVYFSTVDDQAKKVLEFGQPGKIISREMAGGQQKDMFWYPHQWKWLVFSNGTLVVAQ